jgi:glutamate N-acetyltransferase/amino-acid N-acetyltransferase
MKVSGQIGVTSAKGFRAGTAAAGIKKQRGALDLAVLVCDVEASAAGLFTTNRVTGAPVQVSRRRLAARRTMRALVASSGNANVCTGERGLADAEEMTRLAAEGIGCEAEAVLVASTGVIGRFLPMEKIRAAMPKAIASLGRGRKADAAFARALMTTDTRPKQAGVRVRIGGRTVTIGGATKGSGMIEPHMATTLAFLTTDAAVAPDLLGAMLRRAADATYNCLTVDGHQSTSDTMVLLASGEATGGSEPIAEGSAEAAKFEAALAAVCESLAQQIVADAEGGTKTIEIRVTGGASAEEAARAARAVANSPLVKCAFFGEDPNWGRITSAAGGAGISGGPDSMRLEIGGLCIFQNGTPAEVSPAKLKRVMKARNIRVHLDLGAGAGEARVLTCDLSYEYVKINASYTT